MHNVPKWPDALQKPLQQMLQDFKSVSDHFGTLSIKRLSGHLVEKPPALLEVVILFSGSM